VTQNDPTARYIKVEVLRNLYTKDEIEFLIKGEDSVVTFRVSGVGDQLISDFGATRKRLERLRANAGGFGVMGQGMGSADVEAKSGKGPLGQLKTFYGLQSGQGFEDVFD